VDIQRYVGCIRVIHLRYISFISTTWTRNVGVSIFVSELHGVQEIKTDK
jgi:hypothetical protein